MIDEGLASLLENDPTMQLLCAGRVFQGDAPDDAALYPCLTYTFVGGSSDPTSNTTGVIRQRVEISGLAFTPGAAKDLANRVLQIVPGWCQKMADGSHALNTILLNPGTDFVTEQRMFRRMLEFYVLFTLPHQ